MGFLETREHLIKTCIWGQTACRLPDLKMKPTLLTTSGENRGKKKPQNNNTTTTNKQKTPQNKTQKKPNQKKNHGRTKRDVRGVAVRTYSLQSIKVTEITSSLCLFRRRLDFPLRAAVALQWPLRPILLSATPATSLPLGDGGWGRASR